jgi:hypothetical protein
VPSIEPRLQKRYRSLVLSHQQAGQSLASGIHAVKEAASSFAAAAGAYRFFKNPRVTPRKLIEPLLEAGLREAASVCQRYLLVVHDWSQLLFRYHHEKQDRIVLSNRGLPEGYMLQTALLVDDRLGVPLAPAAMNLRAADGVHSTLSKHVRAPLSQLDELDPVMTFVDRQAAGLPTVHIVDAEADSVGHYRKWIKKPGRNFLVRADDRIVESDGRERTCSEICEELRAAGRFIYTRGVRHHGRRAEQWVAEVPVRLLRPAVTNRNGVRKKISGPPVELRLIISQIRRADGTVLATWYLLTNVPADVDAATIALWYYWRWSIESFFKLLKSAGMQVEEWQQTSASAILKRLLVASMSCVTAWQLARSNHPKAAEARAFLVRLSGRQMKHGREFTLPALLAGMWVLLAMLDALESHTMDELRELAQVAFSLPRTDTS